MAVRRSPRVTEVVCAPGNGGIAQIARCVPVDLKDVAAMVRLAEAEQPGLTIVGPELPLSLGIVDACRNAACASSGPRGPRPCWRPARVSPSDSCSGTTFHSQLRGLREPGRTGEGRRILSSAHRGEGRRAPCWQGRHHLSLAPRRHRSAQDLLSGKLLGETEQHILIEEFSKATRSASSAQRRQARCPARSGQDHKRIGEGDTGPNTGGMGVYSTDTCSTRA